MKNSNEARPRIDRGMTWDQNPGRLSGSAPFVDIVRTLPDPCPRPQPRRPARRWQAVGSLGAVVGLLLLAFLVVPLVELYLFVQVSAAIGFGSALVWIVGISLLGGWLVKREGIGALRRANAKVAGGEMPTDEVINGILIVVAGALMLTPGFLTDAVGLVLLFPPSRSVLRVALRRRFSAGPIIIGQRFGAGFGGRGPGRATRRPADDVVDAESWEDPPDRREIG